MAEGHDVGQILQQLGDPVELADSYLAVNPLLPAPFFARVGAKVIDGLLACAVIAPALGLWHWRSSPRPTFEIVALIAKFAWVTVLCAFTVATEYEWSKTPGKWANGLHVVHESGRRVSLGGRSFDKPR